VHLLGEGSATTEENGHEEAIRVSIRGGDHVRIDGLQR
jgi:hypothetical protein